MTSPTKFDRSHSPRNRPAAATAVIAGLLLAASACSSNDDGATPAITVASTSSAPEPSLNAPPSTTPPATSETGDARRTLLNEILAAHRDAGEFVGARISLLDRDGSITEVAAGTATIDPTSPPVDLDVPWQIGSTTKTFVAVVVLQLAEEGRIDLDTGIGAFFPDLPGADQITPRQLLQHTSGLNEYLDKPAVLNDAEREWTPSELIAIAEAAGRVGEAGGASHYANTNYIVLGDIIEQVTSRSVADEVSARIVEPLGLTDTGFITGGGAPGYTVVDGSFVVPSPWNPSVGGAAGAMQSTGRDLLLFTKALIDGTLMSPASHEAMQAFIPGDDLSDYGLEHSVGLGLERYSNDIITVIGHLGSANVHSSFIGYDAQRGTVVAVTMNSETAGPQAVMAIETLTALSETG